LTAALDDCCQEVLCRLDWPGAKVRSPLRTLGITSGRSGEGVSTLAAQLAGAAAARQEGRVVFVDANLAAPAAAEIFGVDNTPGLIECVDGDVVLPDALQATAMENLFVLAAGKLDGSPARAYNSAGLSQVVVDLAGHAALAIFDLPPVRQASCVHHLASILDGILLVVEAEAVTWDAARSIRQILTRAGARVVGAVLNKRRGS
jgi:Mrp family chromosome partitioning ATPase